MKAIASWLQANWAGISATGLAIVTAAATGDITPGLTILGGLLAAHHVVNQTNAQPTPPTPTTGSTKS